jgi:hypothetical protein
MFFHLLFSHNSDDREEVEEDLKYYQDCCDMCLYMVSIEEARCLGYTKTSVFFSKHDKLFKIIADEQLRHAASFRHSPD